jgi:protein-disulfide isomerase
VDLGVPANGAEVVVVKFIDWQCPSCSNAHWAYRPVLQKFDESHPGAVRQVIKDYPLSNDCNFQMNRDAHQAACEAAVGARLARERGKEEEFINWIFTAPDQQAITAAQMTDKVNSLLGLQAGEFDKLYAQTIDAVKRDIADAAALHVSQTPTYYVNGVLAKTPEGWLPPALFELAIKIELEAAAQKNGK